LYGAGPDGTFKAHIEATGPELKLEFYGAVVDGTETETSDGETTQDSITIVEIGSEAGIPKLAGVGPLVGGFRQGNGEWGLFGGFHFGALKGNVGFGGGFTFPSVVNSFLDRVTGHSPGK
jgi:hypothetical protein